MYSEGLNWGDRPYGMTLNGQNPVRPKVAGKSRCCQKAIDLNALKVVWPKILQSWLEFPWVIWLCGVWSSIWLGRGLISVKTLAAQ